MDDIVVLGVGMHPFGQFPDKDIRDLSRLAIWEAIDDAGIDPRAINIAYVANCYEGFLTGQDDARAPIVIRNAGLGGMPMIQVSSGSAAGSIAFHEAALAVSSGIYDIAIAVGVEKLYIPGDPARSIAAIATSGEKNVGTDMGLTWIAELAMGACDLMNRWGWTAEHFAKVAAKNRYNGSLNPKAEIQEAISWEKILNSRVVAYPFTRPMCASAAVDGAAAAILCTAKTARKFTTRSLPHVAAMPFKGGSYTRPQDVDKEPGMLSMNVAPRVFADAFAQAGIGGKDIEIAQVHDAISAEELLGYQVLKLCAPGDEAALLESGATSLTGRVPVNTDGGLLSRGHPIGATGLAQIYESVIQMEGRAGARQTHPDGTNPPKVAAIQNAGAFGGPSGGVAVSVGIILKR